MSKIPKPEFVEKYVDEIRTVKFDFSLQPEVQAAGVQIESATVTAEPSGLTVGTPTIAADEDAVLVEVSGGEAGMSYMLECAATTDLGAVMEIFGKVRVVVDPEA